MLYGLYSRDTRACSGPFGGGIIEFAVRCPWTTLPNHKKDLEEETKGLHKHGHTHTHTLSLPQHEGMLCTFPLIACFKRRLIVENYTLCIFFCAPPLSFFSFPLCLHICMCTYMSRDQMYSMCLNMDYVCLHDFVCASAPCLCSACAWSNSVHVLLYMKSRCVCVRVPICS